MLHCQSNIKHHKNVSERYECLHLNTCFELIKKVDYNDGMVQYKKWQLNSILSEINKYKEEKVSIVSIRTGKLRKKY